jgi:hypothetical protein
MTHHLSLLKNNSRNLSSMLHYISLLKNNSHVNSENESHFPTLQNWSCYFKTKPPTGPVPFGALNGVK